MTCGHPLRAQSKRTKQRTIHELLQALRGKQPERIDPDQLMLCDIGELESFIEEPWSRLFQNMRSSKQTELEEHYPSHVVCKWMGNSRKVADKHYLKVQRRHFEEAVQKAVQYSPKRGEMDRNATRPK